MQRGTEDLGSALTEQTETPPVVEQKPIVIEPTRGWVPINFAELWEYRELIGFLARRDISSRYKQTILGASWAVIQPVMTMVVFSIFFGKLARVPSDGSPYPIFSYCGMLPWQFFATATTNSANSLIANSNMLTKVYFPRLVIPISSVIPAAVDFLIAFVILFGMVLYYHIMPTLHWLYLPAFFAIAAVTSLGTGIWLSALSTEYRDMRHVIPFLISTWMYVSPVVYPSSMVPEQWRALYALNPMVGAIEGFRWALLGTSVLDMQVMALSSTMSLILLITGTYYFRRMERRFADVI
jgi:lipopolysaccharide transport system permease protein